MTLLGSIVVYILQSLVHTVAISSHVHFLIELHRVYFVYGQ
jgi:hypothetical protein